VETNCKQREQTGGPSCRWHVICTRQSCAHSTYNGDIVQGRAAHLHTEKWNSASFLVRVVQFFWFSVLQLREKEWRNNHSFTIPSYMSGMSLSFVIKVRFQKISAICLCPSKTFKVSHKNNIHGILQPLQVGSRPFLVYDILVTSEEM
jgi:hypothetical protein